MFARKDSRMSMSSSDYEREGQRMVNEGLQFDEIGYWSEVKLDIVKEYAQAYSTILTKKKLSHVYIDGFAGPGVHIAKSTGEFIPGSPLNALGIKPEFDDYYLVDLDGDKTDHLRKLVGDRSNVHIFQGDCNEILLNEIFPRVRYEDFRRGLCLLDPYGLHLNWQVIETAGKMGTIDLFLNFPIMDMNRNALWRYPDRVPASGIERMTAFWGDESWRDVAYKKNPQQTLFGEPDPLKASNDEVVVAFRRRLKNVAEFQWVPEPMPMRNSTNSIVYYLFFASQQPVASKIVKDIFSKYEKRGAQ